MKKGQSAMEYLMTYGWALLVIVIVIAVLIYINPFKAPEQCNFGAGILCERPILFVSGTSGTATAIPGLLSVRLTNGEQRAITITGIACIRGQLTPNGDVTQWNADYQIGVDLGHQDYIDTRNFKNNSASERYVQCTTAEKDTATGYADLSGQPNGANLHPGDSFSGRLWVAYKYTDDPADAPSKVVGGNLVTQAQ